MQITHLQLSTSTGSSTDVPNTVDLLHMLNELNNSPSNKADSCRIHSPDMKQIKNRHGNKTINANTVHSIQLYFVKLGKVNV